jgi:hypothetical protein
MRGKGSPSSKAPPPPQQATGLPRSSGSKKGSKKAFHDEVYRCKGCNVDCSGEISFIQVSPSLSLPSSRPLLARASKTSRWRWKESRSHARPASKADLIILS